MTTVSHRSGRRSPPEASSRFRQAQWIAVAVGLAAGLLAVAFAAYSWWWPLRSSTVASGPIVLISVDTLRADHLPAYGYTAVGTPAIDALVSDGVLFEHAYSHSPQTLPAHTSLFSGALPFQHGVRDNVGFRVKGGTRLLSHVLRERDFETGGVVSSDVLREETGIGAGFDFYDSRMPPTVGGASIDELQRDGAASLEIAQRWMQARASPRFFLFLHLYEPHAPYSPPDRYSHFAPYDGEIAYADEIVGKLVRYLRSRDWYDRSLIILLSDHGEGLGDHGEQEHGLFLYDEAVRVPLIVKLPNTRERGRRVNEPVQHVDLLPTIVDLVGGEPLADRAGGSLRPLLEGQLGVWKERGIYAEALFGRYHFGWSELFSLTDSKYRFIRAPRPELYDLHQDPRERSNLATERSQAQSALSAALDGLLANVPFDEPEALSGDVRERLASLGYVGPQPVGVPRDESGVMLPDPKDRVHVLVKYRQALGRLADGDLITALDLFEEISREEPAMGNIWQRMARLQLRLGRTQEAISAYKQFVRLNPTSASGMIELASALLKLRHFEAAMSQVELAAQVAPPNEPAERAAAYEMLVRIALAREDAPAVRRYAALGQEADPGLPLVAYAEGRLLYAEGRYEDAWRSFDAALGRVSTRTIPMPDLHLYAADTLAQLGRFEEAEHHFRREIELFPDNMWGYLSLANLYRALERRADADFVLSVMTRRVPSPDAQAAAAKLRTKPP